MQEVAQCLHQMPSERWQREGVDGVPADRLQFEDFRELYEGDWKILRNQNNFRVLPKHDFVRCLVIKA